MMKKGRIINKIWVILLVLFISGKLISQNKMWVSAYYAGWMQGTNNDGYLTSGEIDYSAVTQIIQFSLVPNSDGSIDAMSNSITPANSSSLISAAHAAGAKVIICIGGWNSESNFLGATSPLNLTNFVSNIVDFVKARGYDGVDIDWETLNLSDALQYTTFITALRTALNGISPRPLLTAATAWQPALFATLSSMFDEINLMSYDFSGAWPGWVTWHNSPVYDGGIKFLSTGSLLPSINDMVDLYTAAGVPANKLGIGIDFYGYVWSGGSGTATGGVTAPNQTWTIAPAVQANVPYSTIMQQYYNPSYYRWDANANASYLSIDNSGSANDKFISYDDEASCKSKVNYVKSSGLGGVIIWELGGGYRSSMPAGQQDLLLQSVKAAVKGGSVTSSKDTTAPSVAINAPASGASVNGSVTINVNAGDNVGVTGVVIKVDGTQVGNILTSAPYTFVWNTANIANGAHTISAAASDAAGNSSTASVNVVVNNSIVADTSNLLIYQGNLSPGWNNSSWNASTNFTYSNIKYVNQNSLNVVQNPNGALSLNSGSSSSPIEINPGNYKSVMFAIYGEASNLNISVYLKNSFNGTFPIISYGNIPANIWTSVALPLAVLDPSNLPFDKIIIEDVSGIRVTYDIDNLMFSTTLITDAQSSNLVPNQFKLEQNYPNPFNPSTTIEFSLPVSSHVTLSIYNILGERVAILVDDNLSEGEHSVSFNAGNLASGVYIYQLRAGKIILQKKMNLLK